jgi:hypothetical protein
MVKSSVKNNPSLLDFIINNPSEVQDIFMSRTNEDIHAGYLRSVESRDFGAAIAGIAGLVDLDLRGVSGNKFGRGFVFSEFMEIDLDWDSDLGHKEARALGTVIGYWMANKPQPKTHYWAQQALSLAADIAVVELNGNVPVDPADFPIMSLLHACHAQLHHSGRDHHVKPIISGFSTQFREGVSEGVKNIEKAMFYLSADVYFPALAGDVIKEALDGDLMAWSTLVNIYCADDVIGKTLKDQFDSSLREMDIDPSQFLFDMCGNLLNPAYYQGHIVENIQKFIIGNEVIRPRLAGHIGTEQDVAFITNRLGLSINTLFKKEDMQRSARRALLSGDLNL